MFEKGVSFQSLPDAVGHFGIGGLSVAGGGAAPSSLLTDLVAYWLFQEATGSRADSVGASTLLEVGGATGRNTGPGAPLSYGAEFVTARTLTCLQNAALTVGDQDFTLAGWLYSPGYSEGILSCSDYPKYKYNIRVSNEIIFYSGDQFASTAPNDIVLNTWIFVRVWYDKTAGMIYLRVNEDLGQDYSHATTYNSATGTYDVKFGFEEGGGASFNNGRLAGWGLWKRLLTDGEAAILAAGGSAGVYPF